MVLLLALAHFLTLQLLDGLIFLASHVPTRALSLDPFITALAGVEWVLVAPRKAMLWLWPGEHTPGFLGLSTTIANSLIWGLAFRFLSRLPMIPWSRR